MVAPSRLACEIDIQPGGQLQLPPTLLESVGPGHWLVTLERIGAESPTTKRDHSAFLNGYVPEDEGLYDDYPAR